VCLTRQIQPDVSVNSRLDLLNVEGGCVRDSSHLRTPDGVLEIDLFERGCLVHHPAKSTKLEANASYIPVGVTTT
jgi:hypothetical protein